MDEQHEDASDDHLHGRPVWPDEVTVFAAEGVTAEQVGRYPQALMPTTVPALIHAGVEPDEAARWVEHGAMSGNAIVELKRAGFAPENLDRWPERLHAEIVHLHRAGIGPEDAAAWSERWYGRDIIHLAEQRIRPDEAADYPEWLPARWVARFWWLGVDGDAAHDLVGEPDEPVDPYDRMSTISQADTERLARIWKQLKAERDP